ncbi:MAG: hypothetical protein JW912_02405 [Sedimentisphaerales bacterium]|nr:hypothetical protein [Sedimentisphaerales bacterium]
MKHFRWQIFLGIGLVALSAILYFVHFLIFRDSHHVFIYLLGDIAFVPMEVLLVTLIIHRLLTVREKKSKMRKLNMVIGTFFSEVGTDLLKFFSKNDPKLEEMITQLSSACDWPQKKFTKAVRQFSHRKYKTHVEPKDISELCAFLVSKRNFLIRLLGNPTLLEHDSFTDLLWAVFHLAEELASRRSFEDVPDTDLAHINGDIERAYTRIVVQWLIYMKHLKASYPYLFSLAMRKSPFNPNASVVVKE